MMFARAVYDNNPIYRDPEYAADSEVAGIIAPPTFTEVWQQFKPDYAWRPAIGEPWIGSGATSSGRALPEGSGSVLHAEQHYEYHRPVQVGDVLTMTSREGSRWEKDGRRGRLRFREFITEFRDQDDGLVVTSRTVEVETGSPGDRRDDS